MECKYYPAELYKHPACDLYMPGFCSKSECYKIDKVSESEKKRRKYETKIEEEPDTMADFGEEEEAADEE